MSFYIETSKLDKLNKEHVEKLMILPTTIQSLI